MRYDQYIRVFRSSARRRGLFPTLRLLLDELTFDLQYGTDTRKRVYLKDLSDVDDERARLGNMYQAVSRLIFASVMRQLKARHAYALERQIFLDLGCGKGRALILALNAGFREVIGVELSETLCGVCRSNVERYRRRRPGKGTARVVCADVSDYAIPDDVTFLFTFNSFGRPVFEKVFTQVDRTLQRNPRALTFVYVNPEQHGIFAGRGLHKLLEITDTHGGRVDAVVYVSDGATFTTNHEVNPQVKNARSKQP